MARRRQKAQPIVAAKESSEEGTDDNDSSKTSTTDTGGLPLSPRDGEKPPLLGPNDTFWAVLWLFFKLSTFYAFAWGLCGAVAAFLVCSSDEGRAVLLGLSCTVLLPMGCLIGFLKATRRGWLHNNEHTGIVRRRVQARLARWLERHHRWEDAAEMIAHKFPAVVESILSERSYTILKWVLPIFLPSAKAVFKQLDRLKHQPHMKTLAAAQNNGKGKRDMAESLTSAVSDLCDAHVERWEFRLTVLGLLFFAASAGLGGVVDSALVDA